MVTGHLVIQAKYVLLPGKADLEPAQILVDQSTGLITDIITGEQWTGAPTAFGPSSEVRRITDDLYVLPGLIE